MEMIKNQEKFNKIAKECFDSGIEKVVIHFKNNARLEAGAEAFIKMIS